MIRCPQCHTELAEGKRFCPQCGARLPEPPPSAAQLPSEGDAGKTMAVPPAGDAGRTVLLPPEGDAGRPATPPSPVDAGKTIVVPPTPAGDAGRTVLLPPEGETSKPATPPSPVDAGKTMAVPPAGDAGRTVLLPSEHEAGKTMAIPPAPSAAQPTSSAGMQTILADQPRQPAPPTPGNVPPSPQPSSSGGGFGLPPSQPPASPASSGGLGLPPSSPPAAGGGFGLPASPPTPAVGSSAAPSTATGSAKKGPNWLLIIGIILGVLALGCLLALGGLYIFSQQAAQSPGAAVSAAALLFRYQDEQNFYILSVDGRGRYRIARFDDGNLSLLRDWASSPAINAAGSPNRLKVEMVGDTLTFCWSAPCQSERQRISQRRTGIRHGNLG